MNALGWVIEVDVRSCNNCAGRVGYNTGDSSKSGALRDCGNAYDAEQYCE
jgi:hypothetical protein